MNPQLHLFAPAEPSGTSAEFCQSDADLDAALTDARRELLRLVKLKVRGAVADPDEMSGLRRRVLDLAGERQRRHPPIGGGFVVGKRRRTQRKTGRRVELASA